MSTRRKDRRHQKKRDFKTVRGVAGGEPLERRQLLSVAPLMTAEEKSAVAAIVGHAPPVGEEATATRSLVVVDAAAVHAGAAGMAGITASFADAASTLVIDSDDDLFASVQAELSRLGGISAIHLVSHGSPGVFTIGSTRFSADTIDEIDDGLVAWNRLAGPGADLYLWGCDIAAGDGASLIDGIHAVSGFDVAASIDATGPARLGGDFDLEYEVGDVAKAGLVAGVDVLWDNTLAASLTASTDPTNHAVFGGPTKVDAGITASGMTATSISVKLGTGSAPGDTLSVPDMLAGGGVPAYTRSFNSGTGTLTINATSPDSFTAANVESLFQAVTFAGAADRGSGDVAVTFSAGGLTATKTVAVTLFTETQRTNLAAAFTTIESSIATPISTQTTAGKDDSTEVPFTGRTVSDLFYPSTGDTDKEGKAIVDLTLAIQPYKLGTLLSLGSTATATLEAADVSPGNLVESLSSELSRLVGPAPPLSLIAPELGASTSIISVTTDTVREGDAVTAVTFTLDVLATRGADAPLDLDTIADDLGITLVSPPNVTVGGGVRYKMTVSLDLATLDVTVSFDESKTGGFGGLAFEDLTTDIAIGMIGGQLVGASGSAGVLLPLDFGGNASRTVADWGSATVGSFATATGTANFTLPIEAGINGTTVTTAATDEEPGTQVVVADADIFDGEPPLYTTTDFDTIRWFAGITTERVIQQLLDVGGIYGSLADSGSDLLGVTVPFIADTSLGDIFDFKSLFDAEIGSKIDIYQPILNTTGRDELIDWRLPISEDSTPLQSFYSDLRGSFAFGIVVNESWPVHTVNLEARDRNTLADLVSDINEALGELKGGSGIGIIAEAVSNKLVFKASDIAVQSFAIVPVAVESGRLSPADGEGKTVGDLEPGWYTVTSTKQGSVTGTNFYGASTPLGAAARHAGLLGEDETGVVRVHAASAGLAIGSTRHGITSVTAIGASTQLVSSGEVDLARLGITPLGEPLVVLDTADTAGITATLPLRTETGVATFLVGNTTATTPVTVAAQDNGAVADTLAAVNAALVVAGVSANVQARLVTKTGEALPEGWTGPAYLQLFRPKTSGWTELAIAPVSDGKANETVELGFLVGDIAARPRPAALRTFDDFKSEELFPNITITPVYTPPTETSPGYVTMQFAASGSSSFTRDAAIGFRTSPLGAVTFGSNSTVSLDPTYGLAFGVRFNIGPSSPAVLIGGAAPVADGKLTADATFSLDLVMQDRYSVVLPAEWTTANTTVQDLVGDLNRALGQATDTSEEPVDLVAADRLVARYGQFSGRIELVTASRANDGNAVTITPALLSGKLDADLDVSFTYGGRTWSITVPAADAAISDTLQSRIGQLNTALADATPTEGDAVSLFDRLFFTTRSTSAGGIEVLLASTHPPDESWPATVRMTAARTDAAVTALGFSDGGSAATSGIVARASGVTAAVTNHANGQPFASGSLETTLPSLSGSTMLGFNTINFGGTSGAIDAKVALTLPQPVSPAVAVADLSGSLDRTLTNASGDGPASAGLTLASLSATSLPASDPAQTIEISVADLSAITVLVDQPLGVPVPVPFGSLGENGFTLTSAATINFIANSSTYSVTVTPEQTADNDSFADLVDDFNDSLEALDGSGGTLVRPRGGEFATAGDLSEQFVIKAVGNRLQVFARVPAANPNYGVAELVGNFGEIGLQGSFGVATVADALADALAIFQTLRFEVAATATTKLPLLGQPLAELISLDTGLARRIDALRSANVTNPLGLAPAISRALGITSDMVRVGFDAGRSAYRIDFEYDTGAAISRNLNLDLEPFFAMLGQRMPEGLGILNDGGGASPLDIVLGGTSVLSVGIDLSDPTSPRTFLYGHDGGDEYGLQDGTSFEITFRVEGDGIAFTAGVGAFGIFIREGTASIGGEVVEINGEEQVVGDAALRLVLTDGEVDSSAFYLAPEGEELDALAAENYAAEFSGVVDVSLPLFAPTEFTPLPHAPDPRVVLSISDIGTFVEASEPGAARDAIASVLTVTVPDLQAAAAGDAPTLFDLLRDPALFLDGIDVFLGTIETALRGLSTVPVPVIGDALGDAAGGVFGWRRGWLRDMKAEMRGAGESVFEVARDGVFRNLGPDGLGILLENNGDRTVAGMIEAATVDAVTLAFVDDSGEPLEANTYGAHGVEFRMRLGQQMLDSGIDLDFSFDALAPLFELSLDGGMRFQLGWDMFIGFGFNITDGFYTIVDPIHPEAQLRFDAFLDTASRDYTVDYRDGAWVVVDGDGPDAQIVNVPGTDQPMRAIAVNESGQDRTSTIPLPGTETDEEKCGCGDQADDVDGERIWWVVAVENSGSWVPATFDEWDRLVPATGSGTARVNKMVEITAVAPLTLRGDLFFLTLQATDKVRLGLRGVTEYDSRYLWDTAAGPQVDAGARDHALKGVNRNNDLPTLFSGVISVNVTDPSASAVTNKQVVADTITGYGLADKTGKLIYKPGSVTATPVREFYEIRVLDVETAVGDVGGFVVGKPLPGIDPILVAKDRLDGTRTQDLIVPATINGTSWLFTIPSTTPIADSKALAQALIDARFDAVIDANRNGVIDLDEEPSPALVSQVSFGFVAGPDGPKDTAPIWWIIEPPARPASTGTGTTPPPAPTVDAYLAVRRMKDDPSKNRLTFDELRIGGFDLMKLDMVARAVVNLELDLSIADNAAIPRLLADLNLDWSTAARQPTATNAAPGSGTTTVATGMDPKAGTTQIDLLPEIGLSNIRLDVGSFLNGVIKPIVEELDKAFEPLDPVLDALQTRIPVLSDIAGRKIELADLLAAYGGPKGQAAATLIDAVIAVRELVEVMNSVPEGVSAQVPLGRFWLPKENQGGRYAYGDILYDNAALGIETGDFQSNPLENEGNKAAVRNALDKLEAQNADNPNYKQPGVAANKRGGFRFPILQDPVNVFKLLMGRDAVLVTYSLPEVDLSVGTSFPLIKIFVLEVGLRFQIDVKAQMHFGYDTYGIRMFVDSGDVGDLFHGFYISDRAKADGSGADVDELTAKATLALYGGVDVVLAKAGIEGGFTFTATVNLNDPNNDGKLRFTEIVDLISYTDNPLDIVDITMRGEVYARYYYWVGLRIKTPWKTYTITITRGGKTFARKTLFTLVFEGSDGPPTYASKITSIGKDGTNRPNTLLLHAGTNAPKRVSNQDPLDAKDGDEEFEIWNDEDSPDTVYVRYLNYDDEEYETYTGVTRILFDGGLGKDRLDASRLHGLPIEFYGGVGDDEVIVGSGSDAFLSIIDGGAGIDTIDVRGGGLFRILGGLGDDDIVAGTGIVMVDGGAGADAITTGAGSISTLVFDGQYGGDTLDLSLLALVNLLDFTESSSPVTALLAGEGSTVSAGAGNVVTFNLAAATELRGSQQRDRFVVTNPTTREANGGRGLVLRGGIGDDTYEITADAVAGVSSHGITIDDTLPPVEVATAGAVTLSDDDCGLICEIAVEDSGLGYSVAPDVVIVDETGSGARAVASLDEQGRVTRIIVTRHGRGYTDPKVYLVNPASYSDKLVFSSTAAAATLDQGGNGESDDYRIAVGGKDFKFVGWNAIGTSRPDEFDGSEIDSVTVNLPEGVLTLAEGIDLYDTFTVNAHRMEQNARIVADTVAITTDHGFQVRYAIDAVNNGDITIRSTGDNLANYATSWANAATSVASSTITGVTVTDAGDHYWFAPSITFAGGGGSGARARATVADGHITGIEVLGGGSGYLLSPRPQVVIAPPASIQVDAMITSTNPGSAVGYGDGRGRVLLYADNGSVVTSGEVFFPFDTRDNTPKGARTIDWLDGDFRYRSMVALDNLVDAGDHPGISVGTGAEFTAVIDADGRVVGFERVGDGGSGYSFDLPPSVEIEGLATAVAIVVGDKVEGLRITYPGEGYGTAPKVTIRPNGFGRVVDFNVAEPALTADGTPLNRVHIQAAGGRLVTVAGVQIGDPAKPLKSDVETFVAQTRQPGGSISLLEKDSLRIGRDLAIDGILTIDGNVTVTTFGGALELGAPVQRVDGQGRLLWQDDAKTIPIYERDADGNIVYEGGQIRVGDASVKLTADDIEVNVQLNDPLLASTGREIILQPVKVDAEIGLSGTRARVEAEMADGGISSFKNVWGGRGYLTAPTVVVAPPGERAFGSATVRDGAVQAIEVVFGGTNYTTAPVVTLIGGGVGGVTPDNPARVTAVVGGDGSIIGFTVDPENPGSGYVSTPRVDVALPGQQARVIAILDTANPDPVSGRFAVSHFEIVEDEDGNLLAGSNYRVAPRIEVAAPYDFTLDADEIDQFNDSFDTVIIGRIEGKHLFHSPEGSFKDGLVLRAPRAGGTIDMNSLVSTGTVSIVGSGNTFHFDTATAATSGTSISIDDNVIVHADVSGSATATDGAIMIFGTGKGMIDGDPLGDDDGDDEDLLLAAHTDVTVTGAIGSRWKLDDLTVTSANRGMINLDQSVRLTGKLDITGGAVRIGGIVDVIGDLVIDASSMVTFSADVSVGGNLRITGATGVTFAGSLTVGGQIEFVGVPGTVRFGGLVTAESELVVTATNKIEFMGGLAASDNVTLTSNEIEFRGGVASIRGPVGGPATGTLVVRPADSARPIRVGTPLGTATNTLDISDIDLAAIAAGWKRVVIGDEVDGTGVVTIGSIGTQQGGRNSWIASTTTIVGGSITVTQKVDVAATADYLELVALGDGEGGPGAGIAVKAAMNQTAGERNDWIRLTSAGPISLEAPIWAKETVSLTTSAGGTITQTGTAAIKVPDLAVIANGAVTLTDEGNAFAVVAIKTTSNFPVTLREDSGYSIGEIVTADAARDVPKTVTVTGIDVGTATATLRSGGTVTQTQPVTAGTLDLRGTGGRWTLTGLNTIGTLTANTGSLAVADVAQMTVGSITASQTTGTAVELSAPAGLILTDGVTTGGGDAKFNHAATLASDISIDVVDGANTGAARFLSTVNAATSGQQSLTITGRLDARESIGATKALEFLSVSGDATLAAGGTFRTTGDQTYSGKATSTGTITIQAGSGKTVKFLGETSLGGLTTSTSDAADYSVEMTGATTTVTAAVTFANSGTVRLGDQAADALHFIGGVTSTAPSTTRLGGTVSATNADATFGRKLVGGLQGVVQLDANTTVSTGSGKATFSGTVDGAHRLVVNASGDTKFSSAVGGGTALAHLETDSSGRTLIDGGFVTTASPTSQIYGDNVLLGADTTLTANNGGDVRFDGTVDSETSGDFGLTVTTSGLTTFKEAVGTTALEYLKTNGGGTTRISGGAVTTSGTAGQVYDDAVVIRARNATLSAGTGPVTFNGTVDSSTSGDFGLAVAASGLTTFNAAVGTTALKYLTSSGGGTTRVAGGSVRTTGNQQWLDDSIELPVGTTFESLAGGIFAGGTTVFAAPSQAVAFAADTGIGTAATPIRIAASSVTADVTGPTGDIHLVGVGDLRVGAAGLTAPGTISLAASGDILVPSGGRIAAGSVPGRGVAATKPIQWSILNNSDNGPGSLRQVINSANTTGVAGVVVFSGSTNEFTVGSRLPVIATPLTIDGIGHGVVINASRQVDSGLILRAAATGSVVRGLTLQNFTGFGITLDGVQNAVIDRNTVTSINTETSMGLYATGDLFGTRVVGNTFSGGLRGALLDGAKNLVFGQIGNGNVLSNNRAAPSNPEFAGTGIRAQGMLTGTVVAGNTFTNNNYGFAFIGANNLRLEQNLFTRNSVAGIYVEGDSRGSSQIRNEFGKSRSDRNKANLLRSQGSKFGGAIVTAVGQPQVNVKTNRK